MADPSFALLDPPVAVYKLPRPTVAEVDQHPDAAFIWSVILATREACEFSRQPHFPRRKPIGA